MVKILAHRATRVPQYIIPIAVGTAVLYWTHSAFASDPSGVATFGYIHSFAWTPKATAGNGLEGTFVYYPQTMPEGNLGLGGFAQVQSFSPAYLGIDLGPQVNLGPFGVELGYAYRGDSSGYAAMHGLHFAPFVSIPMFALEGRIVVPFASSGMGESRRTEYALSLAIKLPIPVFGEIYVMHLSSGLPLRVNGEATVATETDTNAWSPSRTQLATPDTTNIPPALREWLADRWFADGLAEHASVAAFARLTLNLMALGAPSALVRDVQLASLDEIRHAQLCFTHAETYSGRSRGPGSFEAASCSTQTLSFEQLAITTALDGCLGEEFGARLAQACADRSTIESIRSTFAAIAKDELGHSELAYRIVEFCLDRGGGTVNKRLTDFIFSMPKYPEIVPIAESKYFDQAGDQGRLGPVEQIQIYVSVCATVRDRLISTLRKGGVC